MLEQLHTNTPLTQRLGLGDEQTRAAPYLRAMLAFLAETPGIGWVYKGSKEALLQLADAADDETLEKRFAELLVIGEQTNEQVQLLTDLARAIFDHSIVLLQYLHERRLPAQSAPLTRFALDAALTAYRNRVANEFMYADHRGIEGVTRQAHVASLLLDDVYVLPRLVPEREQIPVHERERDLLHRLLRDPDLAAERREKLEEEFALLTGERWKRRAKGEEPGLPLAEALKDARHAVVIGSPGVGKSTLSRFLARSAALEPIETEPRLSWGEELIPVVIPLALFAEARRTRSDLRLRAYLDDRMLERGGEALRTAMSEALTAGEALVLLDGVDEVPESAARATLVQAVDEFLAGHERARIVVTSRPYGYVPLRGDIPHFTLPNFSPEQVTEFVGRWQRACERKQHPQAPDLAAARAEADALLAEIRRNPRVEELATNPLMLVIVSLIRHERTRLPEERVQLYHRAVNTLMDTWNQWRSQLGHDAGGVALPLDRLVRVWGAIAEWTRRERNTGVVHRAELKRKLVEVLRDREYVERDAEATADSYLRAAADRAGILEERGQDIFAFWHPTFEEFLAAVELSTPTSRAAEKLLPLADDPRWREVILLSVGYIGVVQRDPETATEVVEALLDRDVPALEPLLHRRLRLAAACIADDVGVRRSLKERVLVQLARLAGGDDHKQMRDTFIETVRALPAFAPGSEAVAELDSLLPVPIWEVRMELARLLSNAAKEDPVARLSCERLMQNHDPDVRCHAALGMARAGRPTPDVWLAVSWFSSVLAKIEPAVIDFLRIAGPDVLSEIGSAIEYFAGRREIDFQEGLFDLFALARECNFEHGDLVQEVSRFITNEDPNLRLQSAKLLRQWGVHNVNVRKALRELLRSEDAGLRLESAVLLREWGVDDMAVREALRGLLSSEDAGLRLESAVLLREWGVEDLAVREALRGLLSSENLNLRYRSVALLNEWGAENVSVRETLLALLRSSGDFALHSMFASRLRQWGVEDVSVRETLLGLLSSEDADLRIRSARLLRAWGAGDESARATLLGLLSSEDACARQDSNL
jgi:hypothetical protein